MKMKNGIKYEVKKLDILFEKPFGIALLSKDNKNIFYAKIVDQWPLSRKITKLWCVDTFILFFMLSVNNITNLNI